MFTDLKYKSLCFRFSQSLYSPEMFSSPNAPQSLFSPAPVFPIILRPMFLPMFSSLYAPQSLYSSVPMFPKPYATQSYFPNPVLPKPYVLRSLIPLIPSPLDVLACPICQQYSPGIFIPNQPIKVFPRCILEHNKWLECENMYVQIKLDDYSVQI